MASQSGAYAALLAGGVVAVAGFTGHSVRDVIAGRSSPLKGLVTEPPPPQGGGGTTPVAFLQGQGSAALQATGKGAKSAVAWAHSVLGTSGGSGAVARWDHAIGALPGIPWCSAFVSAALRNAGVKNLPSDPAYSGSWLNWKGGSRVGSLAQAMPGDLLIFDWGDGGRTDHVALYTGHNRMISGNDHNDSVGESSVPAGALVGIVRPKYPNTKTRKRKLLPRLQTV